MAKGGGGGKQTDARRAYLKKQSKRSYKEGEEIKQLESTIDAGAPPRGCNPLTFEPSSAAGAASAQYAGARTFEELPISQYSKEGLQRSKYVTLTAIQRAALPHALCGRDILGAAKTGSGKTLAFLLPVVEKLYRERVTRMDGLGALVLTPTRELAMQIFEELKKIGQHHDISAGLLIGGKAVKEEQERVNSLNIIIATPGRLLQHMDETPGFSAENLQMLVLDEADRILDMGFVETLDAILANLPQERQTMLFSATQTKRVRDLARLSLQSPEYLAVHSEAATPTPLKLQQAYMVIDLHQKMDVLWSFLKSHLKAKTIVFLSTCKQVRYVNEAFKKLRPGVPLRALHGGMKQLKRMSVFYEFVEAPAMVLFATDIAARGLDFPSVDWVMQADCPEDAATYIHRVGRTARYMAAGRALMLLTPGEHAGMVEALAEAKVPVKQLKLNPEKQQAVTPALQALLSKDLQLKEFAQRALTAYVRSVFLQPNKKVFDVSALPLPEYAASLGLLALPKLRFLKKVPGRTQAVEMGGGGFEDAPGASDDDSDKGDDAAGVSSDEEDEEAQRKARVRSGKDSAAEGGPSTSGRGAADDTAAKSGKHQKKSKDRGKGEQEKLLGADKAGIGKRGEEEESDEDDFLVVKQRDIFASGLPEDVAQAAADGEAAAADRKKKKKKQKIKVGSGTGSRVVFDDEGEALNPLQRLAREGLGSRDSQSADDEGADGDDAAQDNPNLHIRTVMGASRGTIAVAANANGKLPDGLYVVDERADARFASAAALMKSRDALDKARVKALRMEIKHAAKAKRRERDGGDNEMGAGRPSYGGGGHSEEEDIDQGGVQEEYSGSEGPGLESDEGGEDEGGGRGVGSNGDDSMDSAEEQVGGGRRPGSKQKHGVNGKRQRHTEDSDQGHSDGGEGSSGSGSDEVGGLDTRKEMAGVSGGRAAKRGKSAGGVEVAHTGMAHKSASGSDLSLAEQEALALKMLLGGR